MIKHLKEFLRYAFLGLLLFVVTSHIASCHFTETEKTKIIRLEEDHYKKSAAYLKKRTFIISVGVVKNGSNELHINERGSGSFLHRNEDGFWLISTAKHVIDDVRDKPLFIQGGFLETGDEIPVKILADSEAADLVILKTMQPLVGVSPIILLSDKNPIDGTGIMCAGISAYGTIVTTGRVLGISKEYSKRGTVILVDNMIVPGNSGGPCIDTQTHKLVGISVAFGIVGGFFRGPGILVPVSEINRMFHGITGETKQKY